MIGWIISPIATVVTLWVLIKKIQSVSFSYYFLIAISWTVIAVILDYFLLVKVLKPEDGYYKPDVYLYYTLTFILPLLVGLWKKKKAE
jgi:heme/copper-type cytochrome/quinol oxidase subunit 4